MSEYDKQKVAVFEPKTLDTGGRNIKQFTPAKFREPGENDYSKMKQIYGSLAVTDDGSGQHKADSKFKLHPDSKRMLGVESEERMRLEGVIAAEVERRIVEMKDQAFKEGFAQGVGEGKADALKKNEEQFKPVWDKFNHLMSEFDGMKKEMYIENESILLQMIFNIAKEIMLTELKTDREYLKRLCLQVIDKTGIKDHIKIKISKADQENIDTIKEHIKAQYSTFNNIQIEVSDEIELGGCKIETDLIRINASVENQFAAVETALKER